ncbi:Membrane protein [Vibrio tubiashii]|uniref:Membrane protein n=1 Tax=Vibrio tubiashii ATCC 19109 TaxID=1051646 RepID=F9T4C4_9VIBR|nr:membrane protein [Vibrio tubiashii ATCC 19109]AIW16456.1 membrane protein [Vibrio tubiashii ATCC 19109]EGU56241.1 hypothetical protein VITU9109_23385 [Vibrio tubiashii ATCC 19109]EIF04895.1 hypothetical protein VT1337_06421 [Vibrio tubiashii NCIMB 1337 = ATCC 19106]
MGGISIWQLIILSFIILIPLLVFGPILKKAGFSKWWSIVMLLPIANIIAIWLFAYVKWPSEQNNA